MIYRAAAALAYNDQEWATAGLQGQLHVMAVAADATPDWATLVVEGPTEAAGAHGRTWYEWTASVTVVGGMALEELPPHPGDVNLDPGMDRPTAPLPIDLDRGDRRPQPPRGRSAV